MRTSKKYYFTKLNEKRISDKRTFVKTVTTYFSKKVKSSDRTNLTKEGNYLITNCGKLKNSQITFSKVATKAANHMKPPKTIHNQPKRSATT